MPVRSHDLDYEPVTPPRRRHPPAGAAPADEGWPVAPDAAENVSPAAGAAHDPPVPASPRASGRGKGASTGRENWSVKRGHMLSYAGLILYMALSYFRPYELFSSVSLSGPYQPSPTLSWMVQVPFWLALTMLVIFVPTQLALEGTLTARPREVNLALLLIAVVLLSVPQAIDPSIAWEKFIYFLKTIIIFIVTVNVMRTEGRLRGMVFLALSVGCVMSAVALSSFASGGGGEGARARVNIMNMFGDPNTMALHLVMMIPVAAALFLSTPNVIKKAVYGGGALLMMAGTFATLSRGGFLALVGAGGVMAWKLSRRHRLVVVFCFVIAVGAAFVLAPGNYGDRLVTIVDQSKDVVGSASARQAVLYRSIAVALRSPLLGVGVGNFPIVSLNNSVTHNAYTQIAAEVGFPALLIYVLFMASSYKRLRRVEQETLGQRRPRFYHLAVGLQAGLVGYAIGSFFLSVAYEFYVYSFVGYALCLHRLYETGAGQPGSVGRGRQELNKPGEGVATTLPPRA